MRFMKKICYDGRSIQYDEKSNVNEEWIRSPNPQVPMDPVSQIQILTICAFFVRMYRLICKSSILFLLFVHYFVLSSDIFLIWHIPPARSNITIPSSKNDWQISGQDWSSFCQPQSSHTQLTQNKRDTNISFSPGCWLVRLGGDRRGRESISVFWCPTRCQARHLTYSTLSALHP